MPARAQEMFAYLGQLPGQDGGEGLLGVQVNGEWMPLVGTKLEVAEQMKPTARGLAQTTGLTIRLARFSVREDLEVFQPLHVV
jgi:hypothetical protein